MPLKAMLAQVLEAGEERSIPEEDRANTDLMQLVLITVRLIIQPQEPPVGTSWECMDQI
jgi:hypothetical protein